MLYLLVFPTVWTFRSKFEKEAYEETIRAIFEYEGSKALDVKFKVNLIKHFTSSEYFWMNPFKKSVEKWYDATVESARSRSEEV